MSIAHSDVAGLHSKLRVLGLKVASYTLARFKRPRVPSPAFFAILLRFFA
jgi:hypothetical protein